MIYDNQNQFQVGMIVDRIKKGSLFLKVFNSFLLLLEELFDGYKK
jgi:hypothetical protein